MQNEMIRCRQCGSSIDRDLYAENYYHDVTCMNCGARSGKYGDENEAINLWNGKGIKFYLVVWYSTYGHKVLEMWDDEETAKERKAFFINNIFAGTNPLGIELDLSRGIRDTVYVQEIEPNLTYIVDDIKSK